MASKLPRYTLRVEQELLDKIHYISEYNGRSTNKEIEQLIKKHVSDFEIKYGEIKLKNNME